MAEVIIQRRRIATVLSESNPLVIFFIILTLVQTCLSQIINRAPHFIPQVGDMSQFSLLENTPVGTPVYQMKGVDPENGQLRYSISGQYFTVDQFTGVVTLAKPLDREEQESHDVIISITDEAVGNTEANTISLWRVITVNDVNDNPPVFHNRPYIINISEATAVGAEIEVTPRITVTDKDKGVNSYIRVSCSTDNKNGDHEACSTFGIKTEEIADGEFEVRIFLKKELDFESRSAYIISLEASDSSDRPLKAYASVAVTVSDVQDQPPLFLNGPYSATVPENTEPNTSIMDVLARDGDTENQRSILITLEGDSLGYFDIISDKGSGHATIVTTDVPLDRESDIVLQNGGVYNFYIKATELINNEVPADYSVTQVTIIVTDENDHIPQFNKAKFDISIPENIENGSPLPDLPIYVEDQDVGQNSKYNLSLRNIFNSENVFVINTDHGEGRTAVGIKVKDSSKLEYDTDEEDKRLFIIDIVASFKNVDVSSTRVNIKLLDVNDNAPIFKKSAYNFSVLENATEGFKINDVHATDKDYGIFSEIEYTLTGFGSTLFKTDKNNGGLYLSKPLDYEKQKSYSLTLIGKDGGGKVSTTSIFVDIIDVNDNAPTFELPEYSRTIREGTTSFEPQFLIQATDADGPLQGGNRVKFSIESDNSISNNGNVFSIDEDTGEISILRQVDPMDTPRGQYDLVVRATDYGHPPLYNETRVFIRVGVPGNQRPMFKGNYHNYKYSILNKDRTNDFTYEMNPMNYKASIREDAKPGQNVTMVVANDPDGLDDLLTYHIMGGSKDNFIIDEKSGVITVSLDANLDRDVNTDKYEIIVTAIDSGTPIPETATTTIFVSVLDVNDKAPVFNMTDTTTYISERAKIGDSVTKMVAYDTDLNSQLKYSIIEPIKAFSKAGVQLTSKSHYNYKTIFDINEDTGHIFVNDTLDYSQSSIIILTIKVVDINAEINIDKQYDLIEHTIYIQPYADKNPQFSNNGWSNAHPVIVHRVKEDQPIGSTVLVLMADDPLSGHIVSNFKVINSETDLLQVDPQSGQVVLAKHLDYEELSNPNITLTVKATSNDGSKYSTAKIIIQVVNYNDNAPKFEKELYKISVLESIKYPERLLTVKAVDLDSVLTEEDIEKGYSTVRYALKGQNSDLFTIDPETGIIQVAPNRTLDRELQSVLRLEVEAADTPLGGNDQLRSTASVLIDVLDVNDNTPKFDKPVYTAVVPENVPIGISVINMTAIDPDEGLGGEIKYELLDEGESHGLFSIDPSSGEIRTVRALTGRGRTDPYRILIGAADGDGLMGDAVLSLYIGDVSANDGVPRFIQPTGNQTLHISENATIGSAVFQVVASDPDDPTQPSGQLVYSIQESNSNAKVFAIDSKSGLITTRQPLDRERQANYTLVLVVTDRGRPPQQTTRITTISVTDVDDHKPRFARTVDEAPIIMKTEEEIPAGTVVGKLEGVDEDIGPNAAIDYVITVGNELNLFKIERTNDSVGLIKTVGRIDRESASRHILTVKCFKYETIPKFTKMYNRLDPSEIQILIKVLDIDDHLPEFETANLTLGVRLNVPIDTVITTLRATDKDAEALPIEYSIINMTFESPIRTKSTNNITDVLTLNNSTGELRIMKNLIHFADGVFRLLVRANNSIDPKRYSNAHIEISVVRERDLLRMTWSRSASDVRSTMPSLKNDVAAALAPLGLRLQIYDPAPLPGPDRSVDFTTTGSCFQLRRSADGTALSPSNSRAALRAGGESIRVALEKHSVRDVSECGTRASGAYHTPVQHALLVLATALPIAALAAAITLCCMHGRYRRRSRQLLIREIPPPASYASAPVTARLYAEPFYST